MAKIGRNDPCPRGSAKKFKRCHAGAPSPMNSDARIIAYNIKLLVSHGLPGVDAVARDVCSDGGAPHRVLSGLCCAVR